MDEHASKQTAVLDTVVRSIGRSNRSAVRRTALSRVSSFYTKTSISNESGSNKGPEEGVRFGALVDERKRCEVAERLLTVFRRYEDDIVQQYFWSQDFAQDFLCLCQYVTESFKTEKAFLALKGPTHVFGDVHGNLEDLFFFRDKLWPAGMDVTAGKFLFLGDYIDRGMKGLEVLTYLFASKVCSPHKIFMLRGNHELRYINGWEAHYKEKSFLWQCKNRFGGKLGAQVWEAANSVFDYMPLACTIDESVFCSHGGIPRGRPQIAEESLAAAEANGSDTRLKDLEAMALPARISPTAPGFQEPGEPDQLESWERDMAMDLMWGDPCPSNPCSGIDQESPLLDHRGFGPGQRGGAAIMFGQRAVDDFLDRNNVTLMIRAHQATSAGISVTKNGRVITVFSTSSDHALGENSTCAYILVEDHRVTPVNRVVEATPRQYSTSNTAQASTSFSLQKQLTQKVPSLSNNSGSKTAISSNSNIVSLEAKTLLRVLPPSQAA